MSPPYNLGAAACHHGDSVQSSPTWHQSPRARRWRDAPIHIVNQSFFFVTRGGELHPFFRGGKKKKHPILLCIQDTTRKKQKEIDKISKAKKQSKKKKKDPKIENIISNRHQHPKTTPFKRPHQPPQVHVVTAQTIPCPIHNSTPASCRRSGPPSETSCSTQCKAPAP